MKTNLEPIPKKLYYLEDYFSVNGLDKIYREYFEKHKCFKLYPIKNRFSRIDAIMTSGDTNIVIEYKQRNISVTTYPNCIIEKFKFSNMKTASELLGNAPAFYVCDYDDAVLVFQLDFTKEYQMDNLPSPTSNGSQNTVQKYIYYLNVLDADIVIGKRLWIRATKEQLRRYVESRWIERQQIS